MSIQTLGGILCSNSQPPSGFQTPSGKLRPYSQKYAPFGEEINLSGMILTPEVFLNTYEGSWDRNRAYQKPRLEAIWWDKNEKL